MNHVLRLLLQLPEQASSVAQGIDSLHYVVIGTTLGGALLVAALATYWVVRHRASAEHDASHVDSASTSEDREATPNAGSMRRVEIALIAGLATVFTAFWLVGFRQFIDLRTPPQDALPIYGTAKQWMWNFAYPNGDGSKGVLHVPRGRPVKLLLTSRDVIHSFYVPAFRVKQDVLPGRMTVIWFTATRIGRYDLLCAEYCGLNHSRMRAKVVVVAPEHFTHHFEQLDQGEPIATLDRDALDKASEEQGGSMVTRGRRVAADQGCLRCHTVDGTPHVGPTWAHLYGAQIPLAKGGHVVADEEYLTESMMDPASQVHAGFQPVMPTYQGLLASSDVGAIIEYIRSLRDLAPGRESPLPNGPLPGVTLEHTSKRTASPQEAAP